MRRFAKFRTERIKIRFIYFSRKLFSIFSPVSLYLSNCSSSQVTVNKSSLDNGIVKLTEEQIIMLQLSDEDIKTGNLKSYDQFWTTMI